MLPPARINMSNVPDITLAGVEVEAYLFLGMAMQGFEEVAKEYEWWTKELEHGQFRLTLLHGQNTIKFRDDVVHGNWTIDNEGTVVGERNQAEFSYPLDVLRNVALNIWRHSQGHVPRAEDISMYMSVSSIVPTQRPEADVCSPKLIKQVGEALGTQDEWFQDVPQEYGVDDESSATLFSVHYRVADKFSLQIHLQYYTLECHKCGPSPSGHPQVNQPIPPEGQHRRGESNDDWNHALQYVLKQSQQKVWRQHLRH